MSRRAVSRRRRALRGAVAAAAIGCATVALPGQAGSASDSARPAMAAAHEPTRPAPLPFAIGERLEYDVTLGGIGVGKASMELTGTDTVRGHEVYHSFFVVKGGIPFFHVDDQLESWFDPHTLTSYRFIQRIHEGNYKPVRIYELFPERATYQKQGKAEEPSVSDPLDDGAFFYFVRTVPLEIGKTYTFERYFIPAKNPVIVKVLRRDTITVKAGKFATVVIQPIIKSGGVFADGGEALMWLTDDERHLLVQMKVKTPIPLLRSLNLYLRTISVVPPASRDSVPAANPSPPPR